MFPLPYRMPPDAIYSGGQQFGTLPNPPEDILEPPPRAPGMHSAWQEDSYSQPSPLEYARQEEELRRRRTQILQGLPVSSTPGISPAAEALVRNYRASRQVDEQMAPKVARNFPNVAPPQPINAAGAPPGYVQYNQPQELPPEPDPVGFDDAAVRQYMMGRYLNNSTGLDRNMRMRDARVRQADADNGVDRFFSRVVAPMAGGAGGAMGSKGAMEAMQAWQNSLNNNILRNRQFQAAHINDLQANQNVAYNQAMANDPRTLKNQREMMRAYYYGQGVLGRNEHYRNSDSNATQKIENQRQHWGAQEGHWNQQDANAGRRTDIYQQNADTNQEYKRGMLRVNQQNADTRKNLSEEQIRHLQRVDEIAQGRLDETMRIDTARINKIYDDMATGAVNRQKGMAQIDQIYNEMDVKQQKIQFDYDKLTADIEGRNLDREQRDRAEVGRNQRAAAGLSYDKDGKAQYKTDESFRTQVNQPSPSAPSARVRPPVSRNSVVVPRRGSADNGLVAPPPAIPVPRGGGQQAALAYYNSLNPAQKRYARQQFMQKYGVDPDGR